MAPAFLLSISESEAQAPTDPSPAFEVASVKPEKLPPDRDTWGTGGALHISGNRITTSGTLTGLAAYNLKDYQISGAPSWSNKSGGIQYFDIAAKTEGEGTSTLDQVQPMLQARLAERFQLKVHHETRICPCTIW
jgi:uncharacterized protein (TIGR03435 family)